MQFTASAQGVDGDRKIESEELDENRSEMRRSFFKVVKALGSPMPGKIRRTPNGSWVWGYPLRGYRCGYKGREEIKRELQEKMMLPQTLRLVALPSQEPADWLLRQYEKRLTGMTDFERVMKVVRAMENTKPE